MANGSGDREFGWLMNEMNYFRRYHDHKETMAWLATALYIVGIISVAIALDDMVTKHYTRQTTFSTLVLIAAAFALGFVWWQLSKRRTAADNVYKLHARLGDEVPEDIRTLVKVDKRPSTWISEIFTTIAILGATVLSMVIVSIQ